MPPQVDPTVLSAEEIKKLTKKQLETLFPVVQAKVIELEKKYRACLDTHAGSTGNC